MQRIMLRVSKIEYAPFGFFMVHPDALEAERHPLPSSREREEVV
jgi:hypothetical protein